LNFGEVKHLEIFFGKLSLKEKWSWHLTQVILFYFLELSGISCKIWSWTSIRLQNCPPSKMYTVCTLVKALKKHHVQIVYILGGEQFWSLCAFRTSYLRFFFGVMKSWCSNRKASLFPMLWMTIKWRFWTLDIFKTTKF